MFLFKKTILVEFDENCMQWNKHTDDNDVSANARVQSILIVWVTLATFTFISNRCIFTFQSLKIIREAYRSSFVMLYTWQTTKYQ